MKFYSSSKISRAYIELADAASNGNTGSAGSGAVLHVVQFTGDNVATDFAMPDNTDVLGDFYVSEDYDVSLLTDGVIKIARFTVAPTDEQYPRIAYTPIVSTPSTNKDIYHVVVNQTGSNNPSVLAYEVTISDIVVTRSAAGTYLFTKVGGFPTGKCSPSVATQAYTLAGDKLVLTPFSEDVYKLETYAAVNTETLADGVLVNQEIIIEVYKI